MAKTKRQTIERKRARQAKRWVVVPSESVATVSGRAAA